MTIAEINHALTHCRTEPPSQSQKQLNRITDVFAEFQTLIPLPSRDFLDQLVSDALDCQGMLPYDQIDLFHDHFTKLLTVARRAEGRLYRHDGAGALFQEGAKMVQQMGFFDGYVLDILIYALEGHDALETAFMSMQLAHQTAPSY